MGNRSVVLADEHAIVREGVCALLAQRDEYDVVAHVGDGQGLLAAVRDHRPDLTILAISLPGLNGIDCCRRIRKEFNRTRVLCLSMHSRSMVVRQMLDAGAAGYLLKTCSSDDLFRAMEFVLDGKVYIAPELTGNLIGSYETDEGPPAEEVRLTGREREVLQMVAEGKNTKQIAHELGLSIKTVETHRRNTMMKLDMHSVAELTKYAICTGLTTLNANP
jgi:DNA-binding NarL/FixJ family response regulator